MYIVFEYLTYLTLVTLFGLALFTVAVTLLLSRAGVKVVVSLSRRTATHLTRLASRHLSPLSSLSFQRSHEEH
ncbi:MAG: hypothetical protein LAO07_16160 [Acidobacteriia bacterium]|nr:hypothetical protein [Terriglobia bacterium]